MTTEAKKPRWVECADKAAEVLEAVRNLPFEQKDPTLREAAAWMQLACIYRGTAEVTAL